MKKQIICILSLLLFSVFLSGCGGEGTESQQLLGSAGGATFNVSFLSFPELWYNFGIMAKRWAAVLIVASMLFGMVLYDVFKKNREIQKWAFSVLVVKIPLVTFVLVYLYCALYGAFNT